MQTGNTHANRHTHTHTLANTLAHYYLCHTHTQIERESGRAEQFAILVGFMANRGLSPDEIGHVLSLGSGSPRCAAPWFGFGFGLGFGFALSSFRFGLETFRCVAALCSFPFVCFKVQLIYLSLYATLYRYMHLPLSPSPPLSLSRPISLSLFLCLSVCPTLSECRLA